jgi:hypothetical protein
VTAESLHALWNLARFWIHARGGVEGEIDLRRELTQLSGEVNVHEHAGALLLGGRRGRKLRLAGRWRGGRTAG